MGWGLGGAGAPPPQTSEARLYLRSIEISPRRRCLCQPKVSLTTLKNGPRNHYQTGRHESSN